MIKEKCYTCDGSGLVHSHNPLCWTCGGSGKASTEDNKRAKEMEERIERSIPYRWLEN